MTDLLVKRGKVIREVAGTLELLDSVHALWQGGAAAFGRVGQWSDIDLMVIAPREAIPQTFETVEIVLERRAGIEMT